MRLSKRILSKCVRLLRKDPSGKECCYFLDSLKLCGTRTDAYFRQAEALAYPDPSLTEEEIIKSVFRGFQ